MKKSAEINKNPAGNQKIVLYFPKVDINTNYTGPPLGILVAASLVDQAGFNVKIIGEQFYEDPLEELKIQAEDALLVGISTMTGFQITGAIAASKAIRRLDQNIPIVWGGWHPTIFPEEVVQKSYVDFVVRSQGEEALLELAYQLGAKSNNFSNIAGLHWKKNGRIIANKHRPLNYDESWPGVPYHLVDTEKIITSNEFGKRVIPFISSYGCPYECAFCAELVFSKRKWKAMSAEKVLNQIKELQEKHAIDGIVFKDNNFFVDKKRVLKIAEGLLRLPNPIRWGQANGKADNLIKYEPVEWELLKKSGLSSVLIGAESGLDEALDFIHKGAKTLHTVKLVEIADRYEISIWLSLFSGLPWMRNDGIADLQYTIEKNKVDFEATIKLLQEIIKYGSNHRCLYFSFTPYPGTPFYNYSKQLGFDGPDGLEGWSNLSLDDVTTNFQDPVIVNQIIVLQEYILPLLTATRLNIVDQASNPVIKLGAKAIIRIFEKLAWFRWRKKYFKNSLDSWAYKRILKIGLFLLMR